MLESILKCPNCQVEQEVDPFSLELPDNFERKKIDELRIKVTENLGPGLAITGIEMGIVTCKVCGRIPEQIIRGIFAGG